LDEEFSEFAGGQWSMLVRSAVLLGAGHQEAEDLAQATLLRCYVKWRWVERAEHRTAYVARILLNEFRRTRRRRSYAETPRATLPEVADRADTAHTIHTDYADHAEPVAASAAVAGALDRLNAGQREVVVLRYYLQLPEREIADLLDLPAGTVKSRLSRALSRLALDSDLHDLKEGR
jgi:RNA polymerase sigma-70 factor (sigma-E family)